VEDSNLLATRMFRSGLSRSLRLTVPAAAPAVVAAAAGDQAR
jgi:hypothetical protein